MKPTIEQLEAAIDQIKKQTSLVDEGFDWSGFTIMFDGKHLNTIMASLEQSLEAARARVTADEAREVLEWWNNKVFPETPDQYSRLRKTITTLLKERAGV